MVLPVKIGSHAATIVPDAVRETSLRERLTGWRRYALLDRGSYEYVDVDPAMCPPLGYAITEARAYRLSPGDYILAHHDRIHDDLPLELVLDLSAAPVPAEVHYRRRGALFFRVPCVPRSLSIVERGPAVTRNHTYVSKLVRGVVVRLVMLANSA
jgi:hypothetical protein